MTNRPTPPSGGFIDQIQLGETEDGMTRVDFRASLSFPMEGEVARTVVTVSSHLRVPENEPLSEVSRAIRHHLADLLRNAGASGPEGIEQALQASEARLAGR